jgi:hypothetical protein
MASQPSTSTETYADYGPKPEGMQRLENGMMGIANHMMDLYSSPLTNQGPTNPALGTNQQWNFGYKGQPVVTQPMYPAGVTPPQRTIGGQIGQAEAQNGVTPQGNGNYRLSNPKGPVVNEQMAMLAAMQENPTFLQQVQQGGFR